jgi:hypothetical protein
LRLPEATLKSNREFEENLAKLRRVVPVETICMHGSPVSKHDNRLLWEKYNYRNYGIIGEPYLNIDFQTVTYLTDTAGAGTVKDTAYVTGYCQGSKTV